MQTSICDEVADLARQYMMEPGLRGLQRIDEKIDSAMHGSRWDELSKWHRVRFRLLRMQRQQGAIAQPFRFRADSPTPA